jgi:hypothetical protein
LALATSQAPLRFSGRNPARRAVIAAILQWGSLIFRLRSEGNLAAGGTGPRTWA